ncbi:MAG TPA: cyanoexosortase B system-associated protein [Cyanobacteria bacterium UBA11149]|nr:cyanoexosortase B system-associated protein [Cyanobacteria bacterium UBA11367]HBE56268.1 cyanoexosortase B system-associated protein [Cyanobacteria bacterium UBA11366]HBK64620.1 cyanoexosortase B system-associated protein [Cyanobacteria bacterium UBA11166]HBR76183.1 cyanoexosortase B system-associated protein [Cyanobacteria bacterium UBA11159]HBS68155.1 cyanoexosortase B system-associated protein [Cyanobacteria bacterium UBA11153]HBW91017.1 cyanoexosortase B system-associated protein [Cyano
MKSAITIKSIRIPITRAIALLLLLVLVVFGAVPGYLKGKFSWAQLPNMAHLSQIKKVLTTGLEIPGWQMKDQKKVEIGGRKWSYQLLEGSTRKPVVLLLLPPGDSKSQPQVEWVDIDSTLRWQTDSYTKIKFKVEPSDLSLQKKSAPEITNLPQAEVEARFFRAWTQDQTVAVVQWYAWLEGGDPHHSNWFWADQSAQLQRQRVAWMAVCLQIPMEPLGDLKAAQPLAESLAKMVQTALMVGPFVGA